MKKFLLILSTFIIAIICILFYPRKVTHGIIMETNDNYSLIYIDGKLKEVKIPNLNLPKYTVLSFKFNAFQTYDYKINKPLLNRVMVKESKNYELEGLGSKTLSKKPLFYKIDSNDNINIGTSKDIIVGKNNVRSFLNDDRLNTFIIYPMEDYSTTRVGISTSNFSSIYHDKLKIQLNSPCKIYSEMEDISLDIPTNNSITAVCEKKHLNLYVDESKITTKNRLYIKGTNLTLTNINRGYPSFNPSYNGILELYPTEKGIILVNEVNIEDYLYKVVPSEMPIWGGLEALKCQAVAARTYAISDMLSNRYGSLGFYVDDSTKSQVYNNIKPQEISNKAIKNTTGLIMTYNNNPIDAKYYSTSCGSGVNYQDIWFKSDGSSDNKPYLKTNRFLKNNIALPTSEENWLKFYRNEDIQSFDNKSSYFRWNVSFSKNTLEENLNINLKKIYKNSRQYINILKNGKKSKWMPRTLKNLQDIKVLNRSEGGNILEISFIFENVTVNVKKDSFVRRSFRCNNPPKIIRYIGKPLENWTTLPSSFFSIEKLNDTFTLYGGGYGHGVGMSQYGAMYLGKEGKDFKTILNTYYKNIKFNKLY
ncbi:SpoIID/LytB domain-containing protein [Clostridium ganghwense]|uniref:SpoIID/LytB domain-containing protein n=1 Tax=Clostridium ganghwense TaxID=312089 RepID=A0ABT4CSH6_9CLOT|nr:SpoIID/LytB domain-containing protein [Clostridium ganghwense]MCY6371994.1 SpoIID/LytB domain-containing protein [Clostridium ganghwense]